MQCPHCHSEIEGKKHTFALGEDPDGAWQVSSTRCNVCDRLIVELCAKDDCTFPVRPLGSGRPRLAGDVPAEFESDYHTACEILAISPESSAAISRRLLQRFFAARSEGHDLELSELISTATDSAEMQPYLREALRTLIALAKLEPGSEKSLRPHTLIPVQPGEAEWSLDVLQNLLEAHYVQPARLQRLQNALEEKVGPLAPPVISEPQTAVDEIASPDEAAPEPEVDSATEAPFAPPPLP